VSDLDGKRMPARATPLSLPARAWYLSRVTAFASLQLPAPLTRAVDVIGFTEMTPVQEQALPPLLAGQDVIAQARAGSGKTVAFGLALLARIDVAADRVQALVLCPTRELADQVSTELRRLARFIPNLRLVTLCGGVPVRTQRPALERPPQVLVGTPGRIQDHLLRQTITLEGLTVLVLDEADRMLDMGFAASIGQVAAQTPPQRQTMLFSATFPQPVRSLSRTFQRQPVEITVDLAASEVEVEQLFYEVAPQKRIEALAAVLLEHAPASALVFCHTRKDTRDVAAMLERRGFSVLALHGELEQRERDEVLIRFAHKSCAVLVATDIAARGLDIKGLAAVISWELPLDPDVHVHRIGRTGRAGEKGLALSFCAMPERARLAAIEARMGTPARWGTLKLEAAQTKPPPPPMVTFLIDGGKQDKLRAGDLLGALTGDGGLPGDAVGKIDILPTRTYVALGTQHAAAALAALAGGKIKIKGKGFRMSKLG
jgi:ATP-independent RNA helicase DbpA